MSRGLRYLLASIALFLILMVTGDVSSHRLIVSPLDGHSTELALTAQINITSGYKTGKGHPQGFHYKLFQECSEETGISIDIVYGKLGRAAFDALLNGRVDIVAIDTRDTSYLDYTEDFLFTRQFENYVWAVSNEHPDVVKELNNWLSKKSNDGSLKKIYNRFFTSYSLKPYLATMTQRSTICPYDNLIKKHSRDINWDWRLLAAVLKQESRFSIGVRSSRGAMGLMQVLESTAAVYGVTDCYSPSENIKAGVAFLKDIKKDYEEMGLDSTNVVKFTLAAYNAGQSRIRDCMAFAREMGTEPSDWDSVARVIPLMALPEYYEHAEYLRHGSFKGKETLNYVKDILATYDEYVDAVLP